MYNSVVIITWVRNSIWFQKYIIQKRVKDLRKTFKIEQFFERNHLKYNWERPYNRIWAFLVIRHLNLSSLIFYFYFSHFISWKMQFDFSRPGPSALSSCSCVVLHEIQPAPNFLLIFLQWKGLGKIVETWATVSNILIFGLSSEKMIEFGNHAIFSASKNEWNYYFNNIQSRKLQIWQKISLNKKFRLQ